MQNELLKRPGNCEHARFQLRSPRSQLPQQNFLIDVSGILGAEPEPIFLGAGHHVEADVTI